MIYKLAFDKNTRNLLFISIIACLVVYGFEIFNYSMSIDEEFMDNTKSTIALGRWGHSFLRYYFLPEPFAPFFTPFIAIAFLSISSVIISMSIEASFTNKITLIILFVSYPQFAYQMAFANQSDTVAISYLLSATSVYLFRNSNYKLISIRAAFAVAAMSFSVSIYQSIITLPVTIIMIVIAFAIINDEINTKKSLAILAKFILMCIISLIIYKLISNIIEGYTGLNSGGYLSSKSFWFKEPLATTLHRSSLSIYDYFTGNALYGLNVYFVTSITTLIAIISVLLTYRNKLVLIPFIIAITASPFVVNAAFGCGMPPRTLTSLGAAFSGSILICIALTRIERFGVIFAIVISAICASSSTQLFFSDYMSYQSDKLLGNRILTSLYSEYPSFDEQRDVVYFYGKAAQINKWKKRADVFGQSFFSWDGGNNLRIKAFLSANEMANLKPLSKEDSLKVKGKVGGMPVWPEKGSIKIIDGIYVVKLGGEPGRD
jgi:hypothetical protein